LIAGGFIKHNGASANWITANKAIMACFYGCRRFSHLRELDDRRDLPG